MTDIHYHYDQLTDQQRTDLDAALDAAMKVLKERGVKWHNGDPIERAADAFAAAIMAADVVEGARGGNHA